MTKGKITLIQKDSQKGTAVNNYRPIKCLPMIWKILTIKIRKEINYSLRNHKLFPEEPKGCRKETRGTRYLLYIEEHILKES